MHMIIIITTNSYKIGTTISFQLLYDKHKNLCIRGSSYQHVVMLQVLYIIFEHSVTVYALPS